MRRLHVIPLMLLLCVTVAGCLSNHAKVGDDEKLWQAGNDKRWQTYSNEFFSIKYPHNWHIWQDEVEDAPDAIPGVDMKLSKSARLGLVSNFPSSLYGCVIVQKSSMGADVLSEMDSPKYWRDFSILNKQFDDCYIDILEGCLLDSISFGPYPAAMVGYVVVPEEGDTFIQKQLVVVVDKRELYFLNNQHSPYDEREERLGDSILATIRFKIQ